MISFFFFFFLFAPGADADEDGIATIEDDDPDAVVLKQLTHKVPYDESSSATYDEDWKMDDNDGVDDEDGGVVPSEHWPSASSAGVALPGVSSAKKSKPSSDLASKNGAAPGQKGPIDGNSTLVDCYRLPLENVLPKEHLVSHL